MEEIADRLGATVEHVSAALEATPVAGSLYVPAYVADRGRERPHSVGEPVADGAPETDPETSALMAAQHASAREALDKLRTDDRLLRKMRYGLDDAPPDTLEELGNRLGISREAVRKRRAAAFDRLSDTLDRGAAGW